MYNVFRLTGRYEQAAYLRELFDEPATVLYQVWSLIRTIDDTFKPESSIPLEALLNQADKLILTVVDTLEGEKKSKSSASCYGFATSFLEKSLLTSFPLRPKQPETRLSTLSITFSMKN